MKKFQAIIDAPFAQLGVCTAQTSYEFVSNIDFLPLGSHNAFLTSEFTEVLAQDIAAYLQSPLHHFKSQFLPTGTSFQQSVWRVMQAIEVGKTLTYGEVAAKLKSSPRAVGNACRRNPIPLMIPCHRIVAKNGVGGFAGHASGEVVDIKRWLLAHEAGRDTLGA